MNYDDALHLSKVTRQYGGPMCAQTLRCCAGFFALTISSGLHETKQESQAFSGSAAGRWPKLDHGRRGTGIRGRELIMCLKRQAEPGHGPQAVDLVPVGQAKQGVQGLKHGVLAGITAVSLAAGVPKMAQAGGSGEMDDGSRYRRCAGC